MLKKPFLTTFACLVQTCTAYADNLRIDRYSYTTGEMDGEGGNLR